MGCHARCRSYFPACPASPHRRASGGERMTTHTHTHTDDRIVFENVSKFYGDVLGVNRVTLSLAPGITSLVGPNGSGKTTLMNLMTGLVLPTRGHITVLGMSPSNPYEFFRVVGYC